VDLARDISHGEKVEGELDILITSRDARRRETKGDRQAEELYAASVKRFNAVRDQERRAEWATFHRQQAERHRLTLTDLISHHEAAAERLEGSQQGAFGAQA
jgi:hypothetical protein